MPVRADPAKVEDFCDKDLLQHIKLARFLIGWPIPANLEARQGNRRSFDRRQVALTR